MHCVPQTQIPLEKIVIRLNGSGYPFEKEMSSLRTTLAIHCRKIVVRSNASLRTTQTNPFEKNCRSFEHYLLSDGKSCHPLERLGLSVRRKLSSVRTARAIRKQLPAALLFQIAFTRAVCDEDVRKSCNLNNSSKRRWPSSYEFSWYISCWIAYFAS